MRGPGGARGAGGRAPVSALLFLGIAVAVSLVGCSVLWLRSRQPRSMEAHIREFSRELRALAPEHPGAPPARRPGTRRGHDAGHGPDRRERGRDR
jgi:hypothetical protein